MHVDSANGGDDQLFLRAETEGRAQGLNKRFAVPDRPCGGDGGKDQIRRDLDRLGGDRAWGVAECWSRRNPGV